MEIILLMHRVNLINFPLDNIFHSRSMRPLPVEWALFGIRQTYSGQMT